MGEASQNYNAILKTATVAGINGVAKNAISSVYKHFNNLGGINESQVIKLTEKELISIIQEELTRLKR